MTPTHWQIAQPDTATQQTLAMTTGLSPLLCQLLSNRGITTAAAAQAFLRPSLHDLEDPSSLHGMTHAVERLLQAIRQQEMLAIYGDYDVDGVTATALLVTFFRELGLDVPYYIPDRSHEGYGLNTAAMHELARRGVRVLITVDCGITAVEEIAVARELGIDTIITDHHQPPEILPDAWALLNPHQVTCRYPNKYLCGVGVVFKLITALRAALRAANLFTDRLPNLKRHLDLVTLGTIADVTPLRDENRVLVAYGLRELEHSRKPGLQALRRVSQREGKPANAGEVGFQLAPRLNASGRLGSASNSVALLTTADSHAAAQLAQQLDAINQQRQALQRSIEQAVQDRIARQYDNQPPAAIVLADAAWHHGVVGIVAARIAETFHRPTLLLQIQDGVARGSGRSIPAFDLYLGLQHCAEWLQRFGGHKYAAGLTMDAAYLPHLQEALIRFADDHLSPDDLQPTLHLDATVQLDVMTHAFIEQLGALAPHGAGNPLPLFSAHGVRMASPLRRLGQQGQHAKFRVSQNGISLDVIAFQQAKHISTLPPDALFDIAFTPTLNTWQGRCDVQLQLRAIRPHTGA
jgi:single-stranded-DNA-specific exonuclease